MFPFILFGLALYFGVRTVLERESTEKTSDTAPPNTVPLPAPPVPAPATMTPPGWPASGPSYAECEALMAKLPNDQVKTLVTQAAEMTDAQWADAKSKMISLGQPQLAACLDGARQVMKQIKI